MLRRKVDDVLLQWKNSADKKPLIVKGARQIGKTESIRLFARNHYKYVIEINFALQKQFRTIVCTTIRRINLHSKWISLSGMLPA